MIARLSRCVVLIVGVSVLLQLVGGVAFSAPVPKAKDSKSWIGKTVMSKKPDPFAAYKNPPIGGPQPIGPDGTPGELVKVLRNASWEVKSEKGNRVEVIENEQAFWLDKGQVILLADAVAFYTKAIEADAKDVYSYNFRGWAKHLLGKNEEAVKDFDAFLLAVQREYFPQAPHRVVGLSNRGLVLAELGKFDAAIQDLDEAVKLGHLPAQLNRGWVYDLKGDYKKAAEEYAAILNERPTDVLALNNMAWLRATCPNATFRDGKQAVKLAKQLCEQTDNREGMYLDTLAAAFAEAGDFSAAIKTQEKALEDRGYLRKAGDEAQQRLRLYMNKTPFRSPLRK